jgi:hypothetical protein
MAMLNGNDGGLAEDAHSIADPNAERCESRYPTDFRSHDSMEGIAAIELARRLAA